MAAGISQELWDQLIEQAKSAQTNAYAPYSHFSVGAALLLGSGKIVSGCNVENASFGLTVCAERIALFKAVSMGQREFRALVVVTPSEAPSSPCGACLQVLREFAEDLEILLVGAGNTRRYERLSTLLPNPFVGQSLGEQRR